MTSAPSPSLGVLSIVVPAWNEEAMAGAVVRAAREAERLLASLGLVDAIEVVIVDDGSTDRTAAVLEELSASDDRLVVVRHPRNRGLGAAIRSGLDAASGDLVLYTDADLPFDLLDTARGLHLVQQREADAVFGYRLNRGGEGARRYVYSAVYNALCRVVLGIRIRDVNFAAKFLTRDLLEQLDLHSDGSFIDAEIVLQAKRAGARIEQFGVSYQPRTRGVSTLSSGRVIAGILRELWSYGIRASTVGRGGR